MRCCVASGSAATREFRCSITGVATGSRLLHRRPIRQPQFVASLLKIYSVRAAAELERLAPTQRCAGPRPATARSSRRRRIPSARLGQWRDPRRQRQGLRSVRLPPRGAAAPVGGRDQRRRAGAHGREAMRWIECASATARSRSMAAPRCARRPALGRGEAEEHPSAAGRECWPSRATSPSGAGGRCARERGAVPLDLQCVHGWPAAVRPGRPRRHVNPAFAALVAVRWATDAFAAADLRRGGERETTRKLMATVVSGEFFEAEGLLVHRDGHRIAVNVRGVPVVYTATRTTWRRARHLRAHRTAAAGGVQERRLRATSRARWTASPNRSRRADHRVQSDGGIDLRHWRGRGHRRTSRC